MRNFPTVAAILIAASLATGCSDSSDSSGHSEPLLDRYVLGSQTSVPEGVAFDPVERVFYASSLQGGSITRVAANGEESLFRAQDNRARLVGIKVDADKRLLWACATGVDDTDNRVWVFDLDSGDMDSEFLLGAISTGGNCNDLVLDDQGIAYVTDPANPNIYRLDRATGEGEVFASDPMFQDITGLNLGLNGIEVSPDGSALIVAKFAPPGLFQVSLPDGTEVSAIDLEGDQLPSPDGLEFVDGDLYSISNTTVTRTRLSADNTSGTVTARDYKSGLSTATSAQGQLYVIKSEVFNFVLGTPLELPFEIFRVDLADFDQPQAP